MKIKDEGVDKKDPSNNSNDPAPVLTNDDTAIEKSQHTISEYISSK